jgi:hypothetical protein
MFGDGFQRELPVSAFRDQFLTVVNDDPRFGAVNERDLDALGRDRAFRDTDRRFLKIQFHTFFFPLSRSSKALSKYSRYCPTTISQPVPAQVKQGLNRLLLPVPRHSQHSRARPLTETSPLPSQTTQEALFPGAMFHFPSPPHHAHLTCVYLFEARVSIGVFRQSRIFPNSSILAVPLPKIFRVIRKDRIFGQPAIIVFRFLMIERRYQEIIRSDVVDIS